MTISRIIVTESWCYEIFYFTFGGISALVIKLTYVNKVGEATILLRICKQNRC